MKAILTAVLFGGIIIGGGAGFYFGDMHGAEHIDDRNIYSVKDDGIVQAGRTWYNCDKDKPMRKKP